MKKTLFFIAILLFVGCEQRGNRGTMMPPQMVQILPAQKHDVALNFEYPARIVSDEDVRVRSKVSGTLLKKHFKSGQRVKKGDKLFTIDPKVYKAQYDVQAANVDVAKANLSQAQKEFKRISTLYKKKVTSQQSYDAASAAYEVAKASLAQASAARDSARINYEYTQVIAPFDGVVGDSLVDVGEFIPLNTPLVRITNTKRVFAEFFIPDVQSFNIRKNLQNNIWSRINSLATIAYNGKKYDGNITFIDKVIDASTGSVKAKAGFQNKDNALLVGSFVKLRLEGFSQKNAFKIPSIALQQDLATTFVYVVGELKQDKSKPMPKNIPPYMIPSGVAKMVPINIDYQTDTFVLVSKGLKEGDKIIMNNFKKIRPGAKIKVVGIYGQKPRAKQQKMEKK